MHPIELLAPAKNLACGRKAIDCGADAVYIGAPQFGARENAGNTLGDIEELCAYAHDYWARIYAVVNTLLHDAEVEPARDQIWRLHEAGVDAVIIQDMALLECDLPPIPLFASTQMHNHTPDRVAFLEKVGLQRVILARELALNEIKAIRDMTTVDLECFVHGAACVCYSGQCYMSYALGGRSANRGACAQPCRKSYSLLDAEGHVVAQDKHLLSLRDLNRSTSLKDLLEAGITSFKIEGRLKDEAYVANVTAYYRRALNEAMAELGMTKSSSGTSDPGFTPDVKKTFNRGYSEYYLRGRKEQTGSIDTPKMMGECLGKVKTAWAGNCTLEEAHELHPGDGVCFLDAVGILRGTLISAVQEDRISLDKSEGLHAGTTLYRNRDHEFLMQLKKARSLRKIDVRMRLSTVETGIALSVVDEDDNQVTLSVDCEIPKADKPENMLTTIQRQLSKTGASIFNCSDIDIALEDVCFISIGILNKLRRDALEALLTLRREKREIRTATITPNDTPYPESDLTYHGNVLNKKAYAFYKRHGVDFIEDAAESGVDLEGEQVMTTRYCVREELGICPKASSADPLTLLDEEGHAFELRFTCGDCGMEIYLKESSDS